jgi:hypothetical protein
LNVFSFFLALDCSNIRPISLKSKKITFSADPKLVIPAFYEDITDFEFGIAFGKKRG